MSELDPEGRALFRGARRDLAPSEADRARVEEALAVRFGVAAAAGAAVAGAATSASASVAPAAAGIVGVSGGATTAGAAATAGGASALLLATKWVGAAALVGVLGATGTAAYRATWRSTSTSTPTSTPTPTTTTTPTPTPTPAPTPTPVVMAPPPREQETPRPRVARAAAATAGSVGDETRMIRDADAALRSGDAARALTLLDAHAHSYPNGVLAEERAVERIFALCKLGRDDDARREGHRFLDAHPESPLAGSVAASCAGPRR